jgi:hypothetical protein
MFCWHLKSQKEQDPGFGSVIQLYGITDSDPYLSTKRYRSGTLVDSKVDCLLDIYIAKSFHKAVSDVLSKKVVPYVVHYPGKTISNDDI